MLWKKQQSHSVNCGRIAMSVRDLLLRIHFLLVERGLAAASAAAKDALPEHEQHDGDRDDGNEQDDHDYGSNGALAEATAAARPAAAAAAAAARGGGRDSAWNRGRRRERKDAWRGGGRLRVRRNGGLGRRHGLATTIRGADIGGLGGKKESQQH